MAGYEELDFNLGEDRYLLTQTTQLEARSDGHWQPMEAFTLGFGLRSLASYDHGEQSLRRTRLEGEVLSSRSEQPILVGTPTRWAPPSRPTSKRGSPPSRARCSSPRPGSSSTARRSTGPR